MADSRTTRLTEQLIGGGLRPTPQRLLLLEVLTSQPGHVAAVQARYPHVNKTTVYRTLETLARLGLLSITHQGGHPDAYELRDMPHHHLRCKRCGREMEIPDALLDPLRERVRQDYGFAPCFDHFALVGVCPACQGAP